jgi:hypothetical protein
VNVAHRVHHPGEHVTGQPPGGADLLTATHPGSPPDPPSDGCPRR